MAEAFFLDYSIWIKTKPKKINKYKKYSLLFERLNKYMQNWPFNFNRLVFAVLLVLVLRWAHTRLSKHISNFTFSPICEFLAEFCCFIPKKIGKKIHDLPHFVSVCIIMPTDTVMFINCDGLMNIACIAYNVDFSHCSVFSTLMNLKKS